MSDSFGFKTMLLMAVATSIDALASGIAISFLELSKMLTAAAFIGITTFLLSFAGVFIGQRFGKKFKAKAEFAGGLILILLGAKILLEHLGLLAFKENPKQRIKTERGKNHGAKFFCLRHGAEGYVQAG